jgi:hypothetical protein
MDRLEAVTHIRESPRHDDRHRVLEETLRKLGRHIRVDDLLATAHETRSSL